MKKIFGVFFLLGFSIGVVCLWKTLIFLNESPSHQGQKKIFEVKQGHSLKTISKELKQNDLITDSILFSLLTKILGKASKIRVGEYELKTDMRPTEILDILMSGKSITHVFTVQEGLNKYEIAEHFSHLGLGSKTQFLEKINDPQLCLELLNENLPSLEGYLFPDTYHVTKYVGAEGLIRMMVSKFLEVYHQIEPLMSSPMSRHEIVTLASIVEKETGVPEERSLIASVFHNRLRIQMRLQTDPTVLYGILDQTKMMPQNITKNDLVRWTKYNTYMINGLPFGPISNPGREALLSVLKPSHSPYLFFVSKNDGTHVFSENYMGHVQAVQDFQKKSSARKGKSWRQRLEKKNINIKK